MQEQYAARQERICKGACRVEARAGPVSTKTQPSNDRYGVCCAYSKQSFQLLHSYYFTVVLHQAGPNLFLDGPVSQNSPQTLTTATELITASALTTSTALTELTELTTTTALTTATELTTTTALTHHSHSTEHSHNTHHNAQSCEDYFGPSSKLCYSVNQLFFQALVLVWREFMPETQTSKACDDYKRVRVRASKREREGVGWRIGLGGGGERIKQLSRSNQILGKPM